MNCVICEKEIEQSSHSFEVLCGEECFLTDFWREKVEWAKAGDVTPHADVAQADGLCARIEGCHYVVGERKNPHTYRGFIGFAGREWAIHFISGPHAGRTIDTNNLWLQGEIPQQFLEGLPDNAEFLQCPKKGARE